MAQVVIGGGNVNLGFRWLDEEARRRNEARSEAELNARIQNDAQRIALQRQQMLNEDRRADDNESFKWAQLGMGKKDRDRDFNEDVRRFDTSRGDRLGEVAQRRADLLDERTYGRERDKIGDQRFDREWDLRESKDKEDRLLRAGEIAERAQDRTRQRDREDEQLKAWREDRQTSNSLRERQLSDTAEAKQKALDMEVVDAQLKQLDLKESNLNRQLQQAQVAGRDDLVMALQDELNQVNDRRSDVLAPLARSRTTELLDGDMTIGPRNPTPNPSPRAERGVNVAAELAKEKQKTVQQKRQDSYLKNVMERAGTAGGSAEYMAFVKSEAERYGIAPDDPVIARAVQANPTTRVIASAEKDLAKMDPAAQVLDLRQKIAQLRSEDGVKGLRADNINVADVVRFLSEKLLTAEKLVSQQRQRAEAKTGVGMLKAPTREELNKPLHADPKLSMEDMGNLPAETWMGGLTEGLRDMTERSIPALWAYQRLKSLRF